MKPTIQIVRNHRRSQKKTDLDGDKRTLELRVTYNRVSRFFATNGTLKTKILAKLKKDGCFSSSDIRLNAVRLLCQYFLQTWHWQS